MDNLKGLARAVLVGSLVWLGWPWFLAILFAPGDSLPGLLGVAALLVGLAGLPTLSHSSNRWLRLLSWSPWGPAALGLTWLNPRPWVALLLTLVACPVALLQGLLWDSSQAHQELLFRYKLSQIQRGRLSYCQGWGWVDRRHRLPEVLEALKPGEHRLTHLFFGQMGRGYELVVHCHVNDEWQAWRVVQLLGERCEAEEGRLPWWTGAPLSSYDGDDLPSVYLTLYQAAHPQHSWAFDSRTQAVQRWHQSGRQQLGLRVHNFREFQPPGVSPSEYTVFFERLQHEQPKLDLRVRGPIAI